MNIIYANRILGFTLLFISKHLLCCLWTSIWHCGLIQISFVSLRGRLLRLLRNHTAVAMFAKVLLNNPLVFYQLFETIWLGFSNSSPAPKSKTFRRNIFKTIYCLSKKTSIKHIAWRLSFLMWLRRKGSNLRPCG